MSKERTKWVDVLLLARSKGKHYVCERKPSKGYQITNNDTGTTGDYNTIAEAYSDLYYNAI